MEAWVELWTPLADLAPWPVPLLATPSVGTVSPGFAVSGTAAPAIQAVLTLNLTSDTNLTYLLAGLLDNNTTLPDGQLGVNGYFVNVTDQIPTLGLNTVVLSTLANSSQPDSGVFGAPCALCIPAVPGAAALELLHLHPHDLFSFFAGLWNSFSGVVAALLTHLATLVHALVGIVWNGLIAAEAFFDHIRQGLAHYALVFVHHAVSDLKTAGKILLDGLQVLLAFVLAEIRTLLTVALSPVITATDSYANSVNAAFTHASNDFANNGTLPTSDISSIFATLSGTVFEVGLGIGAILTIALAVATPIDIGPSFLLTMLIGILVTVTLQAISASGMLTPAFANLDGSTVNSLGDFLSNLSALRPSALSSPSATTGPSQADLEVATKVLLALPAFGFGFPAAIYIVSQKTPTLTLGYALAILGVALSLVALGILVAKLVHPSNAVLKIVSVLISGWAAFRSFFALKNPVNSGVKPLLLLVFILSMASAGYGLYTLF